MATSTDRKKISELKSPTELKSSAVVPILQDGDNFKVDFNTLKAFFSDSTIVFFDSVDDATGITPNTQGKPTQETGAVIEIVYLSNYNNFLARKTLKGNKTYFVDFDGIENYIKNGKIRTDKLFFSIADEGIYKSDSNGVLKDPYAPIVLTQEEYDALVVKDENKTYYIVEE
jgi:hypothetical protein